MQVNEGLAALSNNLLLWAIVVYAIAMTCYTVEYAFGSRGKIARAAQPALAGVGAANQNSTGTTRSTPQLSIENGERPDKPGGAAYGEKGRQGDTPGDGLPSRANEHGEGRGLCAEALSRVAMVITGIGALCQVGSLVARGASVHRVPWGNMYEFVCVVCLVGVVSWLGASITRAHLRHLGVFVPLPVVLLLGLAGTVLYADAAPLVPALNSAWLKIHVSSAATASGIFLFGFVTGALFLIREGYDSRIARERPLRFPFTLGPRLPAADTLERVTFRIHALAFPLWTFAVIAGAIWAEAAWTRYWGWDPKETWAFISWVVYAGYLHARATAGWRGKRAVWIVIIGWATMMVNLFVVNLVTTGLHSYAGVS